MCDLPRMSKPAPAKAPVAAAAKPAAAAAAAPAAATGAGGAAKSPDAKKGGVHVSVSSESNAAPHEGRVKKILTTKCAYQRAQRMA